MGEALFSDQCKNRRIFDAFVKFVSILGAAWHGLIISYVICFKYHYSTHIASKFENATIALIIETLVFLVIPIGWSFSSYEKRAKLYNILMINVVFYGILASSTMLWILDRLNGVIFSIIVVLNDITILAVLWFGKRYYRKSKPP